MSDFVSWSSGSPLVRNVLDPGSPALHGFTSAGDVFLEENGNTSYVVQTGIGKEQLPDVEETRVPPGMLFVLGDNRGESKDSRSSGLIPQADVVGETKFLCWPARTWSRFGSFD